MEWNQFQKIQVFGVIMPCQLVLWLFEISVNVYQVTCNTTLRT